MSPTQRSLKYLRDQGLKPWVVEVWNPWAKIRQDLYGIIDIICIGDGTTLAVQTTSLSNISARKKKILENPYYPDMVAAGWKVHIHGWALKGRKYEVKIVELN